MTNLIHHDFDELQLLDLIVEESAHMYRLVDTLLNNNKHKDYIMLKVRLPKPSIDSSLLLLYEIGISISQYTKLASYFTNRGFRVLTNGAQVSSYQAALFRKFGNH